MTTDEQTTTTFEGRPLPRPEEAPYDQGLAFDLTTLINRRNALAIFGVGGGDHKREVQLQLQLQFEFQRDERAHRDPRRDGRALPG
jgi:hypothetical protein